MLVLEGGPHRQHRLHKPGALRTVGPNAPLAPEHPRTTGALCGSVRGLNPLMPDDCPPGLRPLEALPTHPCRLRDDPVWPTSSRRSTSRRIGRLELAKLACAKGPSRPRCPQCNIWRACACKASPIACEGPPRALMASKSRHRCAHHSCRRHGGYQRSPLQRSVTHPPQPLSQRCLGDRATARAPYHKDRDPRGDRRPQPGARQSFRHRLIQMRHRLLLDIAPRFRYGDRYCPHRGLLQVHQGSQTHRHLKQILQEALGGPSRQMIRPRAQGRDRLHARAKSPRRHSWEQLSPAQLSAGGADQAMQLILGDTGWPVGAR